MLTILLGLVAGLILAVRWVRKNATEEDRFISIGMGFSITLAGILGGMLLSSVLTFVIPRFVAVETTTKSYDLVAIKTNASIEGTFFLASGSIKETLYYFYYWEDSNGIHFDKVPMDKVTVHESTSSEAKLVITYPAGAYALFVAEDEPLSKDFYVPQGSVDRSINLSLP